MAKKFEFETYSAINSISFFRSIEKNLFHCLVLATANIPQDSAGFRKITFKLFLRSQCLTETMVLIIVEGRTCLTELNALAYYFFPKHFKILRQISPVCSNQFY